MTLALIADATCSEQEKELPWYTAVFRSVFGSDNQEGGKRGQTGGNKAASNKFIKLSNFKFRRELGMLACPYVSIWELQQTS